MSNIDLTPEIQEATIKVQRTAKDLAPVDTGTLRNSIHRKIYNRGKSNVFGTVATPVEYSIYQEYGTVHQSGTPFMRPAVNRHRLGIIQSMKKYLKENTHKISRG